MKMKKKVFKVNTIVSNDCSDAIEIVDSLMKSRRIWQKSGLSESCKIYVKVKCVAENENPAPGFQ